MNFHVVAQTPTAAKLVEQRLRKAIVSMELPPGTRLSEQDIAEKYGVSRQPVREAFLALARAELLAVMPQRGTVVVAISAERMMQARFIREQIEAGVVQRLAISGLEEVFKQALEGLLREQKAAVEQSDIQAFKSADERFHETLSRAAGLELAWRTIGDIKSHLERACYLTLTDAPAMAPLILQHQAILDAVLSRDSEAAAKAMRFHLSDILRALPIAMERHPAFFNPVVSLSSLEP